MPGIENTVDQQDSRTEQSRPDSRGGEELETLKLEMLLSLPLYAFPTNFT